MRSASGCSDDGVANLQGWWESRRWQIALVLLLALPLLWPTTPPLTDLPGHIGRYKVQLDGAASPTLSLFYGFKWALTGNLGVDLLVIPLAPVFGLELTVKLIAMLIPVLGGAGMLWIAREVHGRVPPTAYFALPLTLGHPFIFGFINFSLSMALALLAFGLWLRLARQGHLRLRALLFVPIGFVIWITHSFGWGFLGLLIYAAEVVRSFEKERSLLRAPFLAALQCLPLIPPLALMILWRTGGAAGGGTGDWFNMWIKWLWFIMSLRERWQDFDLASVAVLVVIIAAGVVLRPLRFAWTLGIASLLLAATYMILPRIIFGSAYADMRLTPYMLAIAVLAVGVKPSAGHTLRQALALLALLFFGARVGATTISFAHYHSRHMAALGALEHIPRGARVVSFIGMRCDNNWSTARLGHIPALAIVRREAFSNDQWGLAGAQLLTIKKTDAPGFVEDPSQLVTGPECQHPQWRTLNAALDAVPRRAFDYLWLMDPPTFDHAKLAGLTPIWSQGADTLYKINP
jgi:hypothetical protein